MSKKYPFYASSSSDPAKDNPLGFSTYEAAKYHADQMNIARETYDIDDTWNKSYWKGKPGPWVVSSI